MLQLIREKSSGWLTWSLVIIISIAMAAFGLGDYFSGSGGSGVAAKINGQSLTWQQVDNRYQDLLRNYVDQDNADITQLDTNQLRLQARQQLVNQLAYKLGLQKHGFEVGEQQVIQNLIRIPDFQQDGKFSKQQFKQVLRQAGLTEQRITQQIRDQILFSQSRDGLLLSSFTLENEVNTLLDLLHQKRDFGYALISIKDLSNQQNISDAAIEAHYNDNLQKYQTAEQVEIEYLDLSLENLMRQVEFVESDLTAFYEQHPGYYATPELVRVRHILINAPMGAPERISGEARAKIDDLLARVKTGESFAQLARKESDDIATKAQGGDLGWLGHGEVEPNFEQAAYVLEKPGDVSEVVETQFGYHIIELTERKEAKQKAFAEVKKEVIQHFRKDQAERALANKGEEMANLAFEQPDSLQPAAAAVGLKVQRTAAFDTKGGEGILKFPAVVNAAFSEEMLGADRNSDLIKIDDERYVVIRIAAHHPPVQQSLVEVKDKIKKQIASTQARKLAEKLGSEFLAAIQAGEGPNSVAKANGLKWKVVRDVTRLDQDIPHEILHLAFSMPKPDAEHPTFKGEQSRFSGDYIVLSLQSVQKGEVPEGEDATDMAALYQRQLAQLMAQTEFALFEQALLDQVRIKLKDLP